MSHLKFIIIFTGSLLYQLSNLIFIFIYQFINLNHKI